MHHHQEDGSRYSVLGTRYSVLGRVLFVIVLMMVRAQSPNFRVFRPKPSTSIIHQGCSRRESRHHVQFPWFRVPPRSPHANAPDRPIVCRS